MTTLLFKPEGPLLTYTHDSILHIDDLNPEAHMTWYLTPVELARLGFCCMCVAWLAMVSQVWRIS